MSWYLPSPSRFSLPDSTSQVVARVTGDGVITDGEIELFARELLGKGGADEEEDALHNSWRPPLTPPLWGELIAGGAEEDFVSVLTSWEYRSVYSWSHLI